ncbi:MAG: ATP-binding cassette domain-containing protein [Alphaproteobacteria bacterium]|nr:ATP-binding cassette domain-containing protein [Alphaproteobacteria bacterium]
MNAISINNLTKSFGGLVAVDALSLDIPAGITTGLIGPNGSGKTTLMNLLTGTLVPDCGEISFPSLEGCHEVAGRVTPLGRKAATPPRGRIFPTDLRKLKIARTFQDGRLINQMSVRDNLLLAIAKPDTIGAITEFNTYDERVESVLRKIHLFEHADKNAEELSYGQRKLLELGRAIITDADIYLLDEPFTGLFPKVIEHVIELLNELKNSGKTLIIIEHNIGLIRKLCNNVIVLDHGQLLADGTPEQVLKNTKVQQAYLGV